MSHANLGNLGQLARVVPLGGCFLDCCSGLGFGLCPCNLRLLSLSLGLGLCLGSRVRGFPELGLGLAEECTRQSFRPYMGQNLLLTSS